MFYCISKTALLTPAYFTCSCSFQLQMLSGSLRILGAFFTCSGSFHLQMLRVALSDPVGAYFTCSGSFYLQILRVALSDQLEPASPLLAVFTCKFSKWLSQTNGSLLLLFRQFLDQEEPTSPFKRVFTFKCSDQWKPTSPVLAHSTANAEWLSLRQVGAYFACSETFHLSELRVVLSDQKEGAYFICSGSFHLQLLRMADQWDPYSPVLAVFTCKC